MKLCFGRWRQEAMKIIGAGLSKTGTTSLAVALRILGFNVYDYDEQMTFHRKQWLDLYFHGVEPDFATMYADVDAVTDSPSLLWFEEILKSFPDAKVILTVRDSEDVWVQSHSNHLTRSHVVFPRWYRYLFPSARERMDFLSAVRNATYGSENPKLSPVYKKKYREHNKRVQAVVPTRQLLVFNVKEGWQPLCNFLGCEIPSQEFPRSNVGCSSLEPANSALLGKIMRQIKREACLLLTVVVGVLAVAIFLVTLLL